MNSSTVPASKRRTRNTHGGSSGRQGLSIMIACAITWSIGSTFNFFMPHDSILARRMMEATAPPPLPPLAKRRSIKTASSSQTTNDPSSSRKMQFVGEGQLSMNDWFSATWLQPLENFMKMKVNEIKTVEDGCFEAFRTNQSAVRMPLDWLDFSVEHMSKVRCMMLMLLLL